jgi:hypothetical protein
MRVPSSRGAYADEDVTDLVEPRSMNIESLQSTEDGLDAISVLDLLKLTPVAQSNGWNADIADRKLPGKLGHPEQSLREAGGILMLSVAYDNTGTGRPGFPGLNIPPLLGAIKPITYSYRPYFVPSHDNKKIEVQFVSDAAKNRVVNVWYGITVKLSFEGKLVIFSYSALFSHLATALVLLASATTVVTYGVLYCGPSKYGLLMYQVSEDFSDWRHLRELGHTVESKPVDYVTGHKILQAIKDSNKLSDEDILSILACYEVRLNKLDGKDPHLAFEKTQTDEQISNHENKDSMRFQRRVLDFERRFYDTMKTTAAAE